MMKNSSAGEVSRRNGILPVVTGILGESLLCGIALYPSVRSGGVKRGHPRANYRYYSLPGKKRKASVTRRLENGDWLRAAEDAKPAEKRRRLGACPFFPRELYHVTAALGYRNAVSLPTKTYELAGPPPV